MSKLVVLSVFILISACHFAFAGPGGSGGGDPRAAQVIEFGNKFGAWLLANPHPAIDIDTTLLIKNIDKLSRSLDTKSPFLTVLSVDSINCFGVPKVGCTKNNQSVEIAGNYWVSQKIQDQDRCVLAATEFSRPQKVTNLYKKILNVCEILYPKQSQISSQQVKTLEASNPFLNEPNTTLSKASTRMVNLIKKCTDESDVTSQAACIRNRLDTPENELEQIILDACSKDIPGPAEEMMCFNRAAAWFLKYAPGPMMSEPIGLDTAEAGLILEACDSFGRDESLAMGSWDNIEEFNNKKREMTIDMNLRHSCYAAATVNLLHPYMRAINTGCDGLGLAQASCYQKGLEYLHTNKEPAPYEDSYSTTLYMTGLALVTCNSPDERAFEFFDADVNIDNRLMYQTEHKCYSSMLNGSVNKMLGRKIIPNQLMVKQNECEAESDPVACYRATLQDMYNHPLATIKKN